MTKDKTPCGEKVFRQLSLSETTKLFGQHNGFQSVKLGVTKDDTPKYCVSLYCNNAYGHGAEHLDVYLSTSFEVDGDNQPISPLLGHAFPCIAQDFSLVCELAPNVVFGQLWISGGCTTRFTIVSPLEATHMLLHFGWDRAQPAPDSNERKAFDALTRHLGAYCQNSSANYHIVPIGIKVPMEFVGHVEDDVIKQLAKRADAYREECTRQVYGDELTESLIKEFRIKQATTSAAGIQLQQDVDALNRRLQAIGANANEMIEIDFEHNLRLTYNRGISLYTDIEEARHRVMVLEIQATAKNEFQAKFETFVERVEALHGWMTFRQTAITVQLPRDKFNTQQRAIRATCYSYSEPGLMAFITDLKAEEDSATKFRKAIEDEMKKSEVGTSDNVEPQ